MSRHRPSFTEKRRRRLALRTAHLDRLETRNTITEPISVTGLSLSAFRGLAQIGIVQPADLSNSLAGLAQAAKLAMQGQARARQAPAPSSNVLPLAIGFQAKRPS